MNQNARQFNMGGKWYFRPSLRQSQCALRVRGLLIQKMTEALLSFGNWFLKLVFDRIACSIELPFWFSVRRREICFDFYWIWIWNLQKMAWHSALHIARSDNHYPLGQHNSVHVEEHSSSKALVNRRQNVADTTVYPPLCLERNLYFAILLQNYDFRTCSVSRIQNVCPQHASA